MKKIALIAATVASLGLAACGGNDGAANEANTADLNTEATENETLTDVNAAAGDAAALNAADNALEAAGNSVENAADAVANVADNATNAQ